MTNAETVFKMQSQLRDAESQLNEIAYEWQTQPKGMNFDSQGYLNLTEAKKVEALRAEVAAAQADIGGVVYRVHNANLYLLAEKFEKLNKRAAKWGMEPVVFTITDEHFEIEHKDYATGKITSVDRYTFVVVKSGKVQISGWQFVAKLDVQEAGVLISKVPAMSLVGTEWDNATKVAEAQAHLDTISLRHLADPDSARNCDHCGLDRRRNATFVLENLETGEFMQVGSSCLKDFLGVDPGHIAKYAEWIAELDGELESDEEGGFGYAPEGGAPVYWYLANVCTMLRTNGWAARSSSDYSTADQASDNVYYQAKQKYDKQGRPMWVDTTDEDIDRAKAALAWADEFLGEKVNQTNTASDFDHNLYIAAKATVVTSKIKGVLAYLPVAHAKFQEKEIEKKAREAGKLDEFFGQVGDRVSLTLKVFSVFESEGYYGVSYITTLRDEAGHPFKWFGSYDLDRGATYTATWTIKDHEDHEKYGKATLLTRPSKMTKISDGE